MNTVLTITFLLPCALGTPSAEPVPNPWFRHNAQLVAEYAEALFGVTDFGLALNELEVRSTSDRQLNQLTNVLMDFYGRGLRFDTFTSWIVALDTRMVAIGSDLAQARAQESKLLRAVRLTVPHNERAAGKIGALERLGTQELDLYYQLLSQATIQTNAIARMHGIDVTDSHFPRLALVHFYRNPSCFEIPIEGRLRWLNRIGRMIEDEAETQRAVDRSQQLLDPNSSWIANGLHNEFLPILASMKYRIDVPAFVQQELEVVEGWLSSSLSSNHRACADIIAESVGDLKQLALVHSDHEELLAERRQTIFQRRVDNWSRSCGSLVVKPSHLVEPIGEGFHRLELLMHQVIETKRYPLNPLTRRVVYSLTTALDQEPRFQHEEIVDILRATRRAIADARHRISEVQIDSIYNSIITFVESMERDVFSGIVEGAYQLGRYGIRVLQFTSLPVMADIRRIVAYWLFCRTTPELRSTMIAFMETPSDVELKRTADSWQAYARAYSRFKKRSRIEDAITGFLPEFRLHQNMETHQIPQLLDWMYSFSGDTHISGSMLLETMPRLYEDVALEIAGMASSMVPIQTWPERIGRLHREIMIPVLQAERQAGSPASGIFWGLTFELAGFAFTACQDMPGEVQQLILETGDALLQILERLGAEVGRCTLDLEDLAVIHTITRFRSMTGVFLCLERLLGQATQSDRSNLAHRAHLVHWFGVLRTELTSFLERLSSGDNILLPPMRMPMVPPLP